MAMSEETMSGDTSEESRQTTEKIIEKAQEEKIALLTESLVTENNVEKLRELYMQTFHVAANHKATKDVLARRIASMRVTGSVANRGSSTKAGAVAKQAVQQASANGKEAIAALERVKDSFDEVERLIGEKRAKSSELRQQITMSREAIQAIVADDTTDPAKRVALLEEHWRVLCRTEEKRSALVAELSEQIKAARGVVRSVLDSVRQIPLPLGGA